MVRATFFGHASASRGRAARRPAPSRPRTGWAEHLRDVPPGSQPRRGQNHRLGAQESSDLEVTAAAFGRLPHPLWAVSASARPRRLFSGPAALAIVTTSWQWLDRKGLRLNHDEVGQSPTCRSHSPLAPGRRGLGVERAVLWLNAGSAGWLAGWQSLLIGTLGGGRGGTQGACIVLSSRGAEQRALSFSRPMLSFLPCTEGPGCKILRQMAPGGPRRPAKWPGQVGQPPVRTQRRGSCRRGLVGTPHLVDESQQGWMSQGFGAQSEELTLPGTLCVPSGLLGLTLLSHEAAQEPQGASSPPPFYRRGT